MFRVNEKLIIDFEINNVVLNFIMAQGNWNLKLTFKYILSILYIMFIFFFGEIVVLEFIPKYIAGKMSIDLDNLIYIKVICFVVFGFLIIALHWFIYRRVIKKLKR